MSGEACLLHVELAYYKTYSDLVIALQNKKIDAFVMDQAVCILLENTYSEIACYPELMAKIDTAYALQKNSPYTQKISEIYRRVLTGWDN